MAVRASLSLLVAFAFPVAALGQGAPDGSRARAALAPLAGLVGQWEGDARVVAGPGEPIIVRQSEDVVWGAGSTVLMIRGTGRSTQAADRGAIVFEAAAFVWFDPEQGRLRMRAHRAEGTSTDADIELRPDSLVWGFPVPGGRVRYVIAFSGDTWHEVGHYLREGAPPVQVIDMRLRRTAK